MAHDSTRSSRTTGETVSVGRGRRAEESDDAEKTVKPRMRGVSHEIAFFVSLVTGPVLAVIAGLRGHLAPVLIYVLAISGLFGVSALLHRPTWRPPVRRWLRRLDHSMIFVAIAGSYTAVAGLALDGTLRVVILALVWGGTILGVTMKLAWIDAPKALSAAVYVGIGWAVIFALPALLHSLGWLGLTLLGVGGLMYTYGAIVYARRRPDPRPAVFGYHEVFHALVIGGALTHYALVAFVALPKAS